MDQSVVGKLLLCRNAALGESHCPHCAKALYLKHSIHFLMPALAGWTEVRSTKPFEFIKISIHHKPRKALLQQRGI
jgi:hypothetical protein